MPAKTSRKSESLKISDEVVSSKASKALPVSRLLSISEYGGKLTHRKEWEIMVALETLREYGALTPEATILGVGAGLEPTGFIVAPDVKWVFMTDMYLGGGWEGTAPEEFVRNPGKFYPGKKLGNVIPIHMDARNMWFPDAAFEGIYSSGSIEHFGEWDEIAQGAREIGRVLKPGGVAAISTEFRLNGSAGGWPGVKVFDFDAIVRYIVEPSGLRLVIDDSKQFTTDADTLQTSWSLRDIIFKHQWPAIEAVLTQDEFQFTSVHLILVKD